MAMIFLVAFSLSIRGAITNAYFLLSNFGLAGTP